MIDSPLFFIFVCSCATLLDVTEQQQLNTPKCRTPDQEMGICISIHACQPINEILEYYQVHSMPIQVKNRLFSFTCGFHGSTPKVCCPSGPPRIVEESNDTVLFSERLRNEQCQTPNGDKSWCISIDSCTPITNYFEELKSRPMTESDKNLLRSYRCEGNGTDIKVCCPLNDIKITEPTTRSVNEIADPPNVSTHKNFHLLPEDCGLIYTGGRIVNGNKTGLFEFPWMALLLYRTRKGPKFLCGATIINDRYLLTAAHCITEPKFPLIGARIGEHDIRTVNDCEEKDVEEPICAPPVQDLIIEEIIPYPQQNKKVFTDDIGLLRVATPINFTIENVKPICLPVDKARNYNFTSRHGLVTGWGITEKGYTSPDLLKARFPIVSFDECTKIYQNSRKLHYRQFCAGGNTTDSCRGDSGGPFQVSHRLFDDDRMVQQGIVSFGPRDCGQQGLPGIYTRVAYYMDWILDNMKP